MQYKKVYQTILQSKLNAIHQLFLDFAKKVNGMRKEKLRMAARERKELEEQEQSRLRDEIRRMFRKS